jgi:CheY-like chemotaxis protein
MIPVAAIAASTSASPPTTADNKREILTATQMTAPPSSLSLSLQLPSSTHDVHGSLQPVGVGARKNKNKMTLLVVDDSDLTRKMLCRIVRAQGFDVEEADDGDVAVQMVQHRLDTVARQQQTTAAGGGQGSQQVSGYECILMDFIMPRLDGPSATKEIRAMGYTGLVLGVTGNGQEFDVKHFKRMGANEVFTKPLNVIRLKEYLRLHNIVAT